METRSQRLLGIRPTGIATKTMAQTSKDERFQNEVLRPIIKLQNDLFIAAFINYAAKHKNAFYALSPERKLLYIENAIQRDIKFRNSLKGMVMGQFTVEEYMVYIENSSALNKRMMNLVIERLKDQVQAIAPVEALV